MRQATAFFVSCARRRAPGDASFCGTFCEANTKADAAAVFRPGQGQVGKKSSDFSPKPLAFFRQRRLYNICRKLKIARDSYGMTAVSTDFAALDPLTGPARSRSRLAPEVREAREKSTLVPLSDCRFDNELLRLFAKRFKCAIPALAALAFLEEMTHDIRPARGPTKGRRAMAFSRVAQR